MCELQVGMFTCGCRFLTPHSMRRARWDVQSSGLKMPFCLVQGWFYRIAIIGLKQETILVLLKFTLNSWVW